MVPVSMGQTRRWTAFESRRDPHQVLRVDLLNLAVLIKYSDRTTQWCPLFDYGQRSSLVQPG